jgi:peptidoglycan/xylan/chitin deacetylase (PgdA/CDA1 family)
LTNKKLTEDQKTAEIEKGVSAVKWALNGISPAPFFRFPALPHAPEMVTYLGTRNIAIISCDIDSFDFKAQTAQQVVDSTLANLEKLGRGIILLHDLQKHTAEALPELLHRLKAGRFKIVAVRARTQLQSLPQYDEQVSKEAKPLLSNVVSQPPN